MFGKLTRAALVVAALALVVAPSAGAAEALYGATADGRLVALQSDAPGDVRVVASIGGLQQNESVVAMDVRPTVDVLYAVTSANRIIQINPVTGATRPVSTLSPGLAGQRFGSDFNPVNDVLRIVSDANQNLRVPFGGNNPGQTIQDGALAYAAGDPGAGTDPQVVATAHTNSTPGATQTDLFGIDAARNTLVRIAPPNQGVLRTVGELGIDVEDGSLDIAGAGNVAYLAARRTGQQRSELYRVDLSTGRAASTASAPTIWLGTGAGDRLRALAAIGEVADNRGAPGYSVAFSSTILKQNTATLRPSVSCMESCQIAVSATVDGIAGGAGDARISGGPGQTIVSVPLNRAARNRIARRGTQLIRLRVTIRDAAGNQRTVNRQSRTQTLAARRAGG
jgi:hypothetical protein